MEEKPQHSEEFEEKAKKRLKTRKEKAKKKRKDKQKVLHLPKLKKCVKITL